jgi:hypothetical protein
MLLQVPISVGELIDKWTILRIKDQRITDAAKRANVRTELDALSAVITKHGLDRAPLDALAQDLERINLALWDIEDDIRVCEKAQDFGPRFIALARAVYVTNDDRARVKKAINLASGSALVEEKFYQDYGTGPVG